MAGRSGNFFCKPHLDDLIPLPEGSELFLLPDRKPMGISPGDNDPIVLDHDPDAPRETIQAVAAFMAPAHTAIHCPFLLTRLSAGIKADSGCQPFAVILTTDRMHAALILRKLKRKPAAS
jgi:hypothetical protein